jgi:hypothetical protein
MSTRITSAFFALGLLFNVLPSSAQYAYHRVASPTEASIDPEDGAKAVSYKLVHGVVQGAQGALPGATVWLHGTKTMVVTNAEGEFELRIPTDAKVLKLTCSYGGLQEEEVSLAPVQALGSVYLLRPN